MSNNLDKQIEVLDKQIERERNQITFNKKAGKSTMINTIGLNELITQRDDLIKNGDSQEVISKIRVEIDENTQTVEKLTERNQILKHGRETYNKMQTEYIESTMKLIASLKL